MEEEKKKIISANSFFKHTETRGELIIIADNLKTPENMGAVIRVAGNFAAKKLIFINKEPINIKKINRFSASVSNLVETHFITDADNLGAYLDKSYKFVCLDTEKTATNIIEYKFSDKIALVIGNEKYGVSNEVLKLCSESVFIPMNGKVKSMNVTHALSIAVFEYIKQIYHS